MRENIFYKIKTILPKKYFFKFFFLLFILIINSLFEILGLSLLIPVFDIIKSEDNFFINYINKFYIIESYPSQKPKLLIIIIFLLIITYSIKTLISLFSIKYTYLLIANLKTDISCNIFSYYLKQQYLYFKNKNSSEILRNVIIEVGELCERFFLSLINFFLDTFLIVAILIFLIFQISTDIYILIIYSVSFTTIFFLIKKKNFFDGGEFRQNLDEKKFSVLKNFLNNLVQVKLLNSEEKYFKDFKNFTHKFEKIFANFTMATIFTRPIFEFLIIIFLCLLFFYKLQSGFEIADIVFSLTILTIGCVRILPSLSRMIFNLGQMIFSYPSVNEIYNETLTIKEKNDEILFKKENIEFNNKIYLDNISFKFPQNNNYVLKNISLIINAKDKICLIGRSGSGKTTLIEIILGLIKPSYGKIIVDDKEFVPEKEKLDISYIPQEAVLFDDTIKNNIILDNEFNKERFEACIKLAKLNDLIENSHFKENTRVGVFGNKISGGQRQRVAFARCFYKPANFIIFDEPFTALDEETKRELKENILSYLSDKTIIFITHDKNLMKYFKKIINLESLL